jgi:hypothetical protein
MDTLRLSIHEVIALLATQTMIKVRISKRTKASSRARCWQIFIRVSLIMMQPLLYGRRILIISVGYEMRNKQVPRVRKIMLNLQHSENNR